MCEEWNKNDKEMEKLLKEIIRNRIKENGVKKE